MALSDNLKGSFLMMGSMTAFTVNDAFLKWLGQSLPFFQILFIRSLAVVVCLALAAVVLKQTRIAREDRWPILIRTFAEIGAAYSFISALFHLPLANVTAIIQALPLTVTLSAAFLFKEAVGWRRLTAIGVGMIGVLFIIQPGTDGFSVYSFYALAAVACVTVRDLAARRLSSGASTLVVALAAAFGVLIFSGIGGLFTEWKPMDRGHIAGLTGSVFFIIGGYIFSVSAMRVGEIGVVAQFRYIALVVALILGFLVFGDWPDNLTLLGAAIVVATGLYTLWREHGVQRTNAKGLRPR